MSRVVTFGDLKTATSLGVAALLSALPGPGRRERAARILAGLHIALRGSKAKEIGRPDIARELALDARKLEKEFLTGVYREMIFTLREYRDSGWRPEMSIEGKRYLDDALAVGNGAVLWAFPCTFGGLVGKKALHAAGYEVAMLASHVHPYSGTRLGMRYLNPVRTRIEDQYIVERVGLGPGPAALAMRRVVELLGGNKLVEIAAIGAADSPARVPFLGGTLNLALGAPTVAALSGAALLPYFPVPSGAESFEICVHAPLETPAGLRGREGAEYLAQQYAVLMEDYVRRTPQVWRGWFNRTNWRPAG